MTPEQWQRAKVYEPDEIPEPRPERLTFSLAVCFWILAALFVGAIIGLAL